ncbi:MAG TPA: tRNA (adenosine(37)-N6)-dimethylallyltransferase MiaA [Vicinamibacteria bacterium]|nr:tRNA (adenosine(37)-N6)-dimethylallyltransferase MiaA [Vicinamibacteria bacterium]
MSTPAGPRLVAIVGPTASGKSALALRLAGEAGGEIVSCDSLQVYRGLDIGSAKASPAERALVPHHLLDVVDPDQPFSAADYARLAAAAAAAVTARGGLPLVAGGTGLYLRALLSGLFEGPSRDAPLRARLERTARRFGDARLHRLLRRVDPAAAARVAVNDRVRVIRALEVYLASGRPISEHFRRPAAPPLAGYRVLRVALDPGRDALRARVEARADAMLAAGLVEETRALLERYPQVPPPLRAIGYREATRVVRGESTVAEARRDMVAATMRYAKRQRTWFRHQEPGLVWFADADEALRAVRAWLAD